MIAIEFEGGYQGGGGNLGIVDFAVYIGLARHGFEEVIEEAVDYNRLVSHKWGQFRA